MQVRAWVLHIRAPKALGRLPLAPPGRVRSEVSMKTDTVQLLACPRCHGQLSLRVDVGNGHVESGVLACRQCPREFPIEKGIPRFITSEELEGPNRRFAAYYDRISPLYGAGAELMYFLARWAQRKARRQLLDRLQPIEGRVLEVSIGTGVNLRYLFEYPGQYEVYGLDISPGQLKQCQALIRKRGWPVDLFVGTAEELPFHRDSFDRVFHVGGINFFTDRRAAVEEMIRVARPGTRIVIADETEKLARTLYDRLPGFSRRVQGRRIAANAPIDLVPSSMQDVHLDVLWKGTFYCLDFVKPA
jgi:ubiquinone/menaquinone biosynthesis C-methylase UbiE